VQQRAAVIVTLDTLAAARAAKAVTTGNQFGPGHVPIWTMRYGKPIRALTFNSGRQADQGRVCFWHLADMAIALIDVLFSW
jgi:hypothetical protein